MRWILSVLTICCLLSGLAVAEQLHYIKASGEQVNLQVSPRRLLLRMQPGAVLEELSHRPELRTDGSLEQSPAGRYVELNLASDFVGKADEALARLVAAGLVNGAGLVFDDPDTGRTFALDRELLLRLRQPARAARVQALAEELGLELLQALDDRGEVWSLRAADARGVLKAAAALSWRSEVLWALPDFLIDIRLHHQPSDPHYSRQWYHQQASGAHIHSQAAWDVTMGDAQVIVAVIDTGVDTDHPDFDANGIVAGYDTADGDSDPTPGAGALDCHGTNCSGLVMAAGDNGEGMIGVCPGCSLMPIRMMDGLSTMQQVSAAYQALSWAADHGAWVLSNSWGVQDGASSQIDLTPFYEAITYAANNGRGGMGSVLLFASGNGESDWYGNTQGVLMDSGRLGNRPEVMAVGGTGIDDQRVAYSDYGPNMSVMAPTGGLEPGASSIFTTDTLGNRGMSRGGYMYTINPWTGEDMQTDYREPDSAGDYTQYFSGTSAACPIAAGVVGLALSANPAMTAAQARMVVEQTADKVGSTAYDAEGWNQYYGYGRVNAARAVRAAAAGFDNPDGEVCAEDFNCATGECWKADPADEAGVCATACASSAECGEGFVCVPMMAGGPSVCMLACVSHLECPEGQVCDQVCRQVVCVDGSECPGGTACPASGAPRHCEVACSGDAECADPALCLPAGGGFLCVQTACTDSGQCPTGTVCPFGGGFCVRPCETDGDCSAPALCVEGVCAAVACADSRECPAGLVCPDGGGTCERPCELDAECTPPALCLPTSYGNTCLALSCTDSVTCPEGTLCSEQGTCDRPAGSGDESGCGCGGRPSSDGGLGLLGLLLLALIRRRA